MTTLKTKMIALAAASAFLLVAPLTGTAAAAPATAPSSPTGCHRIIIWWC